MKFFRNRGPKTKETLYRKANEDKPVKSIHLILIIGLTGTVLDTDITF